MTWRGLTGGPDRGGLIAGVVFVVIGVALFGAELDWWTVRARYVLPVLLIAVGLALLIDRNRR